MKRSKLRHVVLAISSLGLVGVVACGKDTPSGLDLSVAGNYNLRFFNNNTIPYTSTTPGVTVTISSGSLDVTDSGTWTYMLIKTTNGSTGTTVDTTRDAGTYARTSSNITFTSTASSSMLFSGTWSSHTLRLTGADKNDYIFIF